MNNSGGGGEGENQIDGLTAGGREAGRGDLQWKHSIQRKERSR